ncbi:MULTISPECIES: RnfH family protein [unclassified Marinobacter]|uniref:RnfH family protein n=1 Tax=unclassified Marinobacter TaxID=83889 RepID=UPI0008DDB49F|nr:MULTISPECIES: RnfH family protein [unclassified Marinobacter]MBQ0832029.1 RnfH family protein [Marinobacter sp.]OHY73292.1 RnfH family protein [Marinobacter sp. AC-23]
MLKIEVAYARPDKQEIVPVQVAEGTTAIEAVNLSGITAMFPEIDAESIDMGIFGKVIKKPADHELRDGDRVELYRPLQIDPKQARLNRAKKKS